MGLNHTAFMQALPLVQILGIPETFLFQEFLQMVLEAKRGELAGMRVCFLQRLAS